jgi:hypothetical protein
VVLIEEEHIRIVKLDVSELDAFFITLITTTFVIIWWQQYSHYFLLSSIRLSDCGVEREFLRLILSEVNTFND